MYFWGNKFIIVEKFVYWSWKDLGTTYSISTKLMNERFSGKAISAFLCRSQLETATYKSVLTSPTIHNMSYTSFLNVW